MKRIITLILCIASLMAFFSVTVHADEKATLTVGRVTATDYIVEVPVYITSLPSGLDNIMAIDFKYSYDKSVLEYQSTSKGTATGNLFIATEGSVHWADSTDISVATPKINAEKTGEEYPFFTIKFKIIDDSVEYANILCEKASFSGGVLIDDETFEVVKASSTGYNIKNGRIVFDLPYIVKEEENAYGLESHKAIVINVNRDAVPYVDGVKAIKVADRKFMFITDSSAPKITLNYDETAEIVGWGRLHRDDKVTALDALMTLNICGGVIYDEFTEDLNKYIKADPDQDLVITASDALIVNNLSHGKKISVSDEEDEVVVEVEEVEELDFMSEF